jgi:dTDP-glucose 4,6-dehydratase
MTKRTILITGGAGFVGHHVIEHFVKNTQDKFIVIDNLNYSGNLTRLKDIRLPGGLPLMPYNDRLDFYSYDFRLPAEPNLVKELKDVTHILHLGAESHVDGSIEDPLRFVSSNVTGTANMLQLARQLPNLELFVYFSTDEVFGPAPFNEVKMEKVGYDCILTDVGKKFHGYKEDAVHNPKNPYAATKSAGEQLVTAFANTYNLPCIITRTMNVFGERQHPEKFIPKVIKAVLEGGKVSIHATPDKKQAGLRHYIHGRNVGSALLFLLDKKPYLAKSNGDVASYHIVGEIEMDNALLANTIADIVTRYCVTNDMDFGKYEFEMVDFHSSRPGHDLRYALDGSKMKGLGWEPPKSFHTSLKKTVEWFINNPRWLQ